MKVSAKGLHYRALNEKVHQLIRSGETNIHITHVNGQRYIGGGLQGKLRLTIDGIPGNDLAAFMDGPKIRVNAVAPGFIEGEWLQTGLGSSYESVRDKKASEGLLDTVSTPEDIADGILSMITCAKVTGHILTVDTGHTIGPRISSGI